VSANREIDLTLAGLALTAKRLPAGPPFDGRLFYLFYDDDRRGVVKVDNRPLAVRQADRRPIAVHSFGGHAMSVVEAGPGALDGLAWGVFQFGDWGTQDHGAWAYALEAGYQLPRVPWAPWLRAGWNQSSGDDDPNDGEHRTFFQLLPTARIYAQFPFYNLMNNEDLFVQLLATPTSRVNVRADWHWLRVSAARDLWYSGGGATNDRLFGYAGAPANGRHGLAQVLELSVDVKVHDRVSANAYYGHAFGGGVVDATFAGTSANYGYVELIVRY
jgi:hypothetical protein